MADLQTLKNELLDELIKITDEGDIEPSDKFEIIMTRYYSTGDEDLLNQAATAAKAIDDVKARGDAMMQLLDEIDYAQAEMSNTQAEEGSGESDTDTLYKNTTKVVDNESLDVGQNENSEISSSIEQGVDINN